VGQYFCRKGGALYLSRNSNSAANLSTIRHVALNLINKEKTAKVGVKTKRLKAGWDEQYLRKIIQGI